jgi:hypothetical protein
MKKENKNMITTLINEAMNKSQYIKKKNVYTTDYFFNKDFRNCSILFAKTSDIFAKRVKREAFKYIELNPTDTFVQTESVQ